MKHFSIADAGDTIRDFTTHKGEHDQLVLANSLFQGFTGDDAFDLIGGGFLRVQSNWGRTEIQVDLDGGDSQWQTLAHLNTRITNGVLADHTTISYDLIV